MSKKKSALGEQGLDALLSMEDEEQVSLPSGVMENLRDIPVDKIHRNPEQPRKSFSEESLDELADSIRVRGVIQPILVEQRGDEFYIIAGERRFRASQRAGKKEIPAIVKSFTEEEKLEIALIENIQREDLSPIEEALAYRSLIENLDLSQQELAAKVGKKRSTIANSLRLLNLPEGVQLSLGKGEISAGHARAILAVLNPADQKILHSRIREQGLSVREAEALVEDLNQGKRIQSHKKREIPKNKIPEILEIEQKFIDRFGTKVQLKGNLKKGKIEISYFSKEDLNRIYEIIL